MLENSDISGILLQRLPTVQWLFCSPAIQGTRRKGKWTYQDLSICCSSLSRRLPKVQCRFKRLNEGIKGWEEPFNQCVCVCARARVRVCVCARIWKYFFFFWNCAFFLCFWVPVCVSVCVCTLGKDQSNKSTLERVAQSCSPTHLSLYASASSPRRCFRAHSSCKV